ncbi:MAG TPA: hypothetical protein VGR85_15565 [Candidatus Limnocylindria bacterium]|nr:hypothetical protein [Candidatus Limnocylindria bacterium]
MSRSWGHAVLPLDATTRAQDDAYLAGPDEERVGTYVYHRHHWPHCRCGGGSVKPGVCHERREFYICYAYVTGRGGRVSDARRAVCRKHAEAFAKKHGVAMPMVVA